MPSCRAAECSRVNFKARATAQAPTPTPPSGQPNTAEMIKVAKARGAGITTALVIPREGVLPGQSVILDLVGERAVSLDDQDHWGHFVLGLAHSRRRRPEPAVMHLSKSVELNPNFALGHAGLGYAYACGEQPERGASSWT